MPSMGRRRTGASVFAAGAVLVLATVAWCADAELERRSDLLFLRRENPGAARSAPVTYGQIMVERWTGEGPEAIKPMVQGAWYPRWSPDGQLISFVQERIDEKWWPHYDLHVWDLSGGSDTVLPAPEPSSLGAGPEWRPDGRALAFGSGLLSDEGLWLVDWPSGKSHRLTGTGCAESRLSWSADCGSLLFTRRGDDGSQAIVLDIASGQERIVSEPGVDVYTPRWLGPAGDLCYPLHGEGRDVLMVLRAGAQEAQEVQGVATAQGGLWGIVPSPDGRTIAASAKSSTTGKHCIRLTPVDGSEGFEVPSPAPEPAPLQRIAWSSDGRYLAFDADMGGQRDVFVLDVAERSTERVTDGPDDDLWPIWRPARADGAVGDGGR